MFQRHLMSGLLAAFAVFASSSLAQAACCPPACATPCSTSGATGTRTIMTNEWVPETYTTKRTTYRTENVNETYTAHRWECVQEVRPVTRHVTKSVPCYTDKVVTTYKMVPTTETRTVMKQVVTYKQVTTMVTRTKNVGHWECQTVEAREGFFSRLCGKKNDCCDPCPKTKTKKVWVCCKVCVQEPCTKCVRCVECVPCTVTCCVNKCVPCTHTVRCCTHKCVTECVTENCTVNVRKCVPYQATRCVSRCVPVCENVTCTRMVCKAVCTTVADCGSSCGSDACCVDHCKKARKSFCRKGCN